MNSMNTAKLAFFAKPPNVMETKKGEILAALKSFWLVGKLNRIKVSGDMRDADENRGTSCFQKKSW